MDKDTQNSTDWCDFPSLCSSAPCCYRKQCLIFFFHSVLSFPHQDEFYQQLQAIRQPWHIPSDTDSDIMEPPEQDKSEWPTWCFLPPEVCFFFYTPLYCLCFLISFPFFAETENISVSRTYVKHSLEDGGQKTSVRLRKQIQVDKRSVSRTQQSTKHNVQTLVATCVSSVYFCHRLPVFDCSR